MDVRVWGLPVTGVIPHSDTEQRHSAPLRGCALFDRIVRPYKEGGLISTAIILGP